MPVTLAVAAVGLVAGLATIAASRRSPATDGSEKVESKAVDAARRRPAVVRFLARIGRRAAGSTLALGSLIGAFLLAALAGTALDMVDNGSGFARWDEAAAEWGAAHATEWSTTLLKIITQLGASWFAVLLAAVVGLVEYFRRRSADVPLFLAASYLGHAAISNGLKWVVSRERPFVDHLVGTVSSSFPSTHSGTAAAVWAAVALVLGAHRSRRTRIALGAAAVAVAAAVAASRVLLGVHWLTDVIAGVAIGWAWFLLLGVAFGGRLLRLGEPAERIQAFTRTR